MDGRRGESGLFIRVDYPDDDLRKRIESFLRSRVWKYAFPAESRRSRARLVRFTRSKSRWMPVDAWPACFVRSITCKSSSVWRVLSLHGLMHCLRLKLGMSRPAEHLRESSSLYSLVLALSEQSKANMPATSLLPSAGLCKRSHPASWQ
jgi:hypothetical protein